MVTGYVVQHGPAPCQVQLFSLTIIKTQPHPDAHVTTATHTLHARSSGYLGDTAAAQLSLWRRAAQLTAIAMEGGREGAVE